jgi:branched-chain amino acid transport system ATP-binding protein
MTSASVDEYADSDELLTVEHLGVSLGGLRVLNDVDLRIRDGALVCVIGPNGAGKTTLFNCITRTQRVHRGVIRLAGLDLKDLQPHQVAKAGIARTFQHPALFAGMTVAENIAFGFDIDSRIGYVASLARPRLTRRQRRMRAERIDELLERLQLQTLRDSLVGSQPLGVCRFIELARALAMSPKLLLLDEPVAGLNTDETHRFSEIIQEARRSASIAMILIEHDLRFVLSLADSITVLNFGQVIAQGTPAAIASDPRVVEAYLGARRGAR